MREVGPQHPLQGLPVEGQLRDYGVLPEDPAGGAEVRVGYPLHVAEHRLGHAVDPRHLLHAPPEGAHVLHVARAEAQAGGLHPAAEQDGPADSLRPLEAGLPPLVELPHLVVGRGVCALQDDPRRAVVGQAVAAGPQRVQPHVDRQPERGDRRQPRVLVERVEVPQPDHVVRGVRDELPPPAHVDEPPDVLVRVWDYAHPVGPQRPHLERLTPVVALQPPEGGAPEAEVGLGGPPQVAARPERVGAVEQPPGRVLRLHRPALRAADPQGHARDCVLPQLYGRVYRGRPRVVLAVGQGRPSRARAQAEAELPPLGQGRADPVGPPAQPGTQARPYVHPRKQLLQTHILTPPLPAANVMARASASSSGSVLLFLLSRAIRESLT